MKRRRYHYKAIFVSFLFLCIVIYIVIASVNNTRKDVLMIDLSNYSLNDIKNYAKEHHLSLQIKEEYNLNVAKNKLISQSIKSKASINKNDKLVIVISKGPIPSSIYKKDKINELGQIPIMMYHGIQNIINNTGNIGGNIDKDGYNRTAGSFRNDLEMYYQQGYRMTRLKDYVEGNIDVSYGHSPIVLTFDDGNSNNINVTGKDAKGNLIIDPNSAVGILESFKAKYPDYNVTATFFLNSELFNQPSYNNDILKWLVSHGYDIGNHTKNHIDFTKVSSNETQSDIAYMYKLFDSVIPNQYVHIVALPYGSPYNKNHVNFPFIINGDNNGYQYHTVSTLRVGWMPEYSPFHKNFDVSFLKRTRAWDNNGKDFDITMCFNNLETTRYISDGEKDTIVIPDDTNLNPNINKKIIKY